MNKDIYPQSVEFDYPIRCSQHNLKPYIYCEMCMVRSDLQRIKEDVRKQLNQTVSSCNININITSDVLEKHRKQIAELQIEINHLKSIIIENSKDVK